MDGNYRRLILWYSGQHKKEKKTQYPDKEKKTVCFIFKHFFNYLQNNVNKYDHHSFNLIKMLATPSNRLRSLSFLHSSCITAGIDQTNVTNTQSKVNGDEVSHR